MSANLVLKSQDSDNDFQSVEVFFKKGGIILHRHVLTSNEEKSKLYGVIERKFWDKYYCKQK